MNRYIGTLLIGICFFLGLNGTYGQRIDLDEKVELQLEEVTLVEAFAIIEEKAGLSIAYNSQFLQHDRHDSWVFNNQSWNEILDILLSTQGLSYQVKENRILIFQVEEPQLLTNRVPVEQTTDQQVNRSIDTVYLIIGNSFLSSIDKENKRVKIKVSSDLHDEILLEAPLGEKKIAIPIRKIYEDLEIPFSQLLTDFGNLSVSAEMIEYNHQALKQEAMKKHWKDILLIEKKEVNDKEE
ncbi:MAG: STN domain-containing protein [Bacteroidota bacterium]